MMLQQVIVDTSILVFWGGCGVGADGGALCAEFSFYAG
jgi:hypothetical protein